MSHVALGRSGRSPGARQDRVGSDQRSQWAPGARGGGSKTPRRPCRQQLPRRPGPRNGRRTSRARGEIGSTDQNRPVHAPKRRQPQLRRIFTLVAPASDRLSRYPARFPSPDRGRAAHCPPSGGTIRGMDLHFLGAATTVTGSQFLLETGQARILVDCGMFQGGPNESVRNRIPLAYDPATLDAILLTHAHLDHCGLIPHVVKEGFRGPIRATAGTIELARLVLLDSGRLQEEFNKREDRWERRHPDRAEADDAKERAALDAAIDLAEAGEQGTAPTAAAAAFAARSHETVDDAPTSAPGVLTPAPTSAPAAPAQAVPPTPSACAASWAWRMVPGAAG